MILTSFAFSNSMYCLSNICLVITELQNVTWKAKTVMQVALLQSFWGLRRCCRLTGRPWLACCAVVCRLGTYQATIDAICLFDGRICRRRIAIWFACLLPPGFLSVSLDRWAICRQEFGLAHRRAIWLMPAVLAGSVECGWPEWRGHWLYSLLSWKSSRLVRQFLFRQLQQGICRWLQHSVPSQLM